MIKSEPKINSIIDFTTGIDERSFTLKIEINAENNKAIPTLVTVQTTNNVITINIKSFKKRNKINGAEIKKYNQEKILQFKGDDRFDEAFCFSEASPDVLAVAAIIDNEIVGMAGASADSPSFWQIGINVNKNFEGRHIATGLVSMLKADILKKEIVPYYGTSFSNLASQHVAAKAGFEVAWVELITERMEFLG